MCDFCFNKEYKKFDTQKGFEDFESLLNKKLEKQKLIVFDTREDGRSVSDFLYKCKQCDVLWCLSIPDNAWRGYFLNKSNASKYIKKLKDKELKKKKGCLIILCIIIIAILIFTFK